VIITTNPDDYPIDDLQEVATRHADATSAIRTRPLARIWLRTRTGRELARILDTVPVLCAEVDRLRARLGQALADLHNLIAAARATLSADADGESDPLYYLRDELEAQGQLPPQDPERP
jgi:hypothetical protein